MAVAMALLAATLAAAGCGLGPGADVGSVELTVTREYGTVPVLHDSVGAKESDTVMRLLEDSAEITTRYGGGYVSEIEGVAEAEHGGDPYDWFFYVDGVESPIGAADYKVEGGERVWWDYRDWVATNRVPVVVGSWPAPFSNGISGKRLSVVVECEGGGRACAMTRQSLRDEGAKLATGSGDGAIRVLVGPWNHLRGDSTAKLIEAGPAESGVFANFAPGIRPLSGYAGQRTNAGATETTNAGWALVALNQDGTLARRLGPEAGLVAATSRYGGLPVWVVTGGTDAAVREAAEALDAKHLRDHYAVAIEDGNAIPLPVGVR
jgi:hypothetical protein